MIIDTIPPPLSKPSNKSRKGFHAAPEMKEEKGHFDKQESEERKEKRSKMKNEDEGQRKQAHPEDSPPSLPPQREL